MSNDRSIKQTQNRAKGEEKKTRKRLTKALKGKEAQRKEDQTLKRVKTCESKTKKT